MKVKNFILKSKKKKKKLKLLTLPSFCLFSIERPAQGQTELMKSISPCNKMMMVVLVLMIIMVLMMLVIMVMMMTKIMAMLVIC